MNKRYIFIFLAAIAVALVAWYATTQRIDGTTIDSDTVMSGDYTIEQGQKLTIKNKAKLAIEGNLFIQGEINCEDGPLNIVVGGDATINGKLTCDRPEELPDGDLGLGISLVLGGSANFSDKSEVTSNGHIQIVDNENDLAKTQEKVNEYWEEAARDSGEGQRIGPIVEEETVEEENGEPLSFSSQTEKIVKGPVLSLLNNAYAQAGPVVVVGGRVRINTPPPGVKRIVVFFFPNAGTLEIRDFDLTGPDGRAGSDDIGNGCDAKGGDGENAFRFLAWAPNLTVQDFTLNLGNGGKGGDAETKKECDPGNAEGGKGGKAGNFKMIASGNFSIQGTFTVNPGKGGDGGNAIAKGKDGGPGEKGGDAIAKGGIGGDNKKQLRITGTVGGTSNVEIASMYGGDGGKATANPGKGGDGDKCKKGGDGGHATAEGGKGGDASLTLAGGVGRTGTAEDAGGDGGDTNAHAGNAGHGGDCDPTAAGGDGGRGGDVKKAIGGKGGIGTDRDGQDGNVEDETGGDGGNGGDGCPEGKGGKGGKGNPPGEDGKDGKNICPAPKQPGTSVDDSPPVTTPPPVTSPPETSSIGVNPQDLMFEHLIGETDCPQPIGTVNITKTGTGPSNTWKILEQIPAWLDMKTSGSVPEIIPLNFSCVLDEYVTQTVSMPLSAQLTDENGEPIGEPITLKVTGYIGR